MAELLPQFSGVLHFLTRAVASITLRSSPHAYSKRVTLLPSRSPLHEDATQNIAAKGALNKLQIRREEFTAWLHRGLEDGYQPHFERTTR
jgi:hypothetical protein